jgi:hypothetical protein
MLKGLLKFADSLAAFVVVGPLLAALFSTLRAFDGDPRTTPLTCSTPLRGGALLVLTFAAASALGLISGAFFGRGRGIWIAGLTLVWPAFAGANIRQLLGDPDGPTNLVPLIFEALLLVPLTLVFAAAVEMISPISGEEQGAPGHAPIPPAGLDGVKTVFQGRTFFACLAAAIVAAGVVGWLAAISPAKGQALFAAFLGGIAAGWASSFAASTGPHTRPPSLIPPALALPVVSLATFLLLKLTAGNAVTDQTRAIGSELPSQLFGLGRILPLDWLAGGLLGVPVGANWAVSMVERHHHPEAKPA